MLSVTLLWCGFVQGACGQDLTGATALSLSEVRSEPAAALPENHWSFQVEPASYGHASLTEGSVSAAFAPAWLATVQGTGSELWTHLDAAVQARWFITPAFVIGSMASASWSGAAGFPSNVGGSATIHMTMQLDPTWSVACGLDRLLQVHTRFQPPARTLRLGVSWKGAVTVASGIDVSQADGSMFWISAAAPVTDNVAIRGSVSSNPVSLAMATALSTPSIPPILVQVRWVDNLGMKASFALDLP